MKTIDLYFVDAFARRIFSGNVAAICPLKEWLPDDVMQSIAIEHNQSETAFFVPHGERYELRWFTTLGEINLCGHATLGAAHVLFHHLNYPKNEIIFSTRFVGPLAVRRAGEWLTLDFPAWMPEPVDIPDLALKGLHVPCILEAYAKRDFLFVLANEEEIRALDPDFQILDQLDKRVCVTAPGHDCDFVSRFFCAGKDTIREDPVTGSAHSMLIPYWAKRLGKTKMFARQLSARGGELRCGLDGDRVFIGGQAQTYMQGKIFLPL